MAHIINKQRYEKKAIYEKKLCAIHKANAISQTASLFGRAVW